MRRSTSTTRRPSGIILMAIGALMMVVGGSAWAFASSQLSAESITVPSADGSHGDSWLVRTFEGREVAGPLTAMAQAQAIGDNTNATGGFTFNDLGPGQRADRIEELLAEPRGPVMTAQVEAGVDAEVAAGAQIDAWRATAETGANLRASLFTSVLAFGLSLMAIGTGFALIVGGRAVYLQRVALPAAPVDIVDRRRDLVDA